MRFVSITGPKDRFDHFVSVYLNKYNIHLENALTELSSAHDLRPFVEINPYKDALSQGEELLKSIKISPSYNRKEMSPSEAVDIITSTRSSIKDLNERKKKLREEKEHFRDSMSKLEHFRQLDFDINKVLKFRFVKFRFGRIPYDYYKKFSEYAYDSLNTLFLESDRDSEYIWGVYFVPDTFKTKVDAVFTSLHFERTYIPDDYPDMDKPLKTPEMAYAEAKKDFEETNDKMQKTEDEIQCILEKKAGDVLSAIDCLTNFSNSFDVRKQAALTKAKSHETSYFFLCGWLPKEESDSFLEDVEKDDSVECIMDDEEGSISKPPTKLKNFKLFKPFEMFVSMYGLPSYDEMDPTIFVALTYSLIFGMMFGDVGQGLCLVIGGALIYKFKKSNLAAIISLAGIFSVIFGFLYGSIFGYEHVIPHLWLHPMENVMTVLIYAVGFGVIMLFIAMILNIINGIREKDIKKIFFDTNGVAGFVFYGAAIACVLLFVSGKALPATILLILFFGIPLLLIFLRDPLANLIKKKKEILPEGAMYFVEALFELIEVLLSYITNTISFLRIGAFAMIHAAMMGVVMMLAGAEAGGGNILVVILGNILVIAMEGLVVGIQVLRLEYYEMFSRFYNGTGKEFIPFRSKKE